MADINITTLPFEYTEAQSTPVNNRLVFAAGLLKKITLVGDNYRNLKTLIKLKFRATTGSVKLAINSAIDSLMVVGVHTGGDSQTVLIDSAATFLSSGIQVGDVVRNTTDVSSATVASVDSNIQITTTTLSGGSDDTYQVDDDYEIDLDVNASIGTTSPDMEVSVHEDDYIYFKTNAQNNEFIIHG